LGEEAVKRVARFREGYPELVELWVDGELTYKATIEWTAEGTEFKVPARFTVKRYVPAKWRVGAEPLEQKRVDYEVEPGTLRTGESARKLPLAPEVPPDVERVAVPAAERRRAR
jgi:hypothetical protein